MLLGTQMPTRNNKGFLLGFQKLLTSYLTKFSYQGLGRLLYHMKGSGSQDRNTGTEKRHLPGVEAEIINGWKREHTVKSVHPEMICSSFE